MQELHNAQATKRQSPISDTPPHQYVIPAKAGIPGISQKIPAFAGITGLLWEILNSYIFYLN